MTKLGQKFVQTGDAPGNRDVMRACLRDADHLIAAEYHETERQEQRQLRFTTLILV